VTGGSVTVTAANTYSGTTAVTGGRLQVNNATGSGTGTSVVNVTGTGAVGSGGTLGGTGGISGSLTVSSTTAANQGGTLSPGTAAAIGTLASSGTLTLNPLGTYVFKYNGSATAPVAGTDNDTINPAASPAGTLNLANLSGASRFTVVLTSVGTPTSNTPVTYTAGSFTSIVLPSGFNNPGDVTSLFSFSGQFVSGSALAGVNGGVLTFTFTPVPEPTHVLLVCGAVAGGLIRWRRRRAGGQAAVSV
jgi:autotransporter-associated beta strand protein